MHLDRTIRLARHVGFSPSLEALITGSFHSLVVTAGWRSVADLRASASMLPFEFFPLVETDEPTYYGVLVEAVDPVVAQLALYDPYGGEHGCYRMSCGNSGIWLAVQAIEYAKVDAPKGEPGAREFLVEFAHSIAPDADVNELRGLVPVLQAYRQADVGTDIRELPWFRRIGLANDPPNLPAARQRMAGANELLEHAQSLASGVDLWEASRGAGWRTASASEARRRWDELRGRAAPVLRDVLEARGFVSPV